LSYGVRPSSGSARTWRNQNLATSPLHLQDERGSFAVPPRFRQGTSHRRHSPGSNGPNRGSLPSENALQPPDSQATFSGSRCGRLSRSHLPSLPTPDRLLLLIQVFAAVCSVLSIVADSVRSCQPVQGHGMPCPCVPTYSESRATTENLRLGKMPPTRRLCWNLQRNPRCPELDSLDI
jgi:hypothetical protein